MPLIGIAGGVAWQGGKGLGVLGLGGWVGNVGSVGSVGSRLERSKDGKRGGGGLARGGTSLTDFRSRVLDYAASEKRF